MIGEIRIDVVKLALAFQLAVFGLIGLSKIGIELPIIRQIVVFFYLAFVPGMLILRLRDMKLNQAKILLFSFGISLVFITLLSTFIDVLLASIGFEKPISEIPLLASISIGVLLLTAACYFKGKPRISFSCDSSFLSPLYLSFLLLPLVSILASYASSFGGNDFFVLLLLALIAIIPLFISLDKFPESSYPLVILSCSISLAFLRFGNFIFKPYSLHETGIAGVIKSVGIWVPDFDWTHNSLLYTAILHPVFSILLNLDILIEVYMIGFFINTFLPLILYEIYTKFFNRKISILSSFLTIIYPFFNFYILGTRDGFAILFLSFFFLAFFSNEINSMLRKALLILFAFSIIVSHYGNAYYFMLLLFAASLIEFTVRRVKLHSDFQITAFCCLYLLLSFSWFIYTSASANLNWAVNYGENVYRHLSEFLRPESSATMQAVFTKWGFVQEVTKYLLFANTFFIIIGVSKLLNDLLKGRRIWNDYTIFALAFSLGMLVFLLPKVMGTPRIYILLLVILAPFSFFGFSFLLNGFRKVIRIKRSNYTALFSVFLILLILFGSGFVSSVIAKATNKTFDPSDPARWFPVPNEYDIHAIEWFLHHNAERTKMYIDRLYMEDMIIREGELNGGYPNFPLVYAGRKVYDMNPFEALQIEDYLEKDIVEEGNYIYLGYHNIVYNFIGTINEEGKRIPLKTSDYVHLFEKESKIYENGVSKIYLTR